MSETEKGSWVTARRSFRKRHEIVEKTGYILSQFIITTDLSSVLILKHVA